MPSLCIWLHFKKNWVIATTLILPLFFLLSFCLSLLVRTILPHHSTYIKPYKFQHKNKALRFLSSFCPFWFLFFPSGSTLALLTERKAPSKLPLSGQFTNTLDLFSLYRHTLSLLSVLQQLMASMTLCFWNWLWSQAQQLFDLRKRNTFHLDLPMNINPPITSICLKVPCSKKPTTTN